MSIHNASAVYLHATHSLSRLPMNLLRHKMAVNVAQHRLRITKQRFARIVAKPIEVSLPRPIRMAQHRHRAHRAQNLNLNRIVTV